LSQGIVDGAVDERHKRPSLHGQKRKPFSTIFCCDI